MDRDSLPHVTMGFSVLHYEAYDMTCQCVDALLKTFEGQSMVVVVVDNASPNGSGAKLEERYKEQPNVHVLLGNFNEGFARGNNIGYQWLRDNYSIDYITVMNNDVIVEQPDFIDVVERIHQEQGFAVLGPDIVEPGSGCHRNPYRASGYTYEEGVELQNSMRRWDRFFVPRYLVLRYMAFRSKGSAAAARNGKGGLAEPWQSETAGCMLQGSCYVFSREYLDVRSIAFCPQTFLYFEEAILARDCEKLRLTMRYSPQVRVLHVGGVSTKTGLSSGYAREKAKNARHLDSVRVFVDRYYDEDVANR